jgi:hypothetical protein
MANRASKKPNVDEVDQEKLLALDECNIEWVDSWKKVLKKK